MAQTEYMLQLLKDGKKVGYERKRESKISGSLLTEQSYDGTNWFSVHSTSIKHDSIGQGTKVDDEWWFEGGIFEITSVTDEGERVVENLTLCWDEKRKAFMFDDGIGLSYFVEIYGQYKYTEYIGTIYEKELT